MMTLQEINKNARKMGMAYEKILLPLVVETDMPHTAITILLFIANNPDFATARDICEMSGLKRPNVSAHVERLVQEGYIERRAVPGDRRLDALVCTEKATRIVEMGRARQVQFAEALLDGITEEERAAMEHFFNTMNANIDKIIKEK